MTAKPRDWWHHQFFASYILALEVVGLWGFWCTSKICMQVNGGKGKNLLTDTKILPISLVVPPLDPTFKTFPPQSPSRSSSLFSGMLRHLQKFTWLKQIFVHGYSSPSSIPVKKSIPVPYIFICPLNASSLFKIEYPSVPS